MATPALAIASATYQTNGLWVTWSAHTTYVRKRDGAVGMDGRRFVLGIAHRITYSGIGVAVATGTVCLSITPCKSPNGAYARYIRYAKRSSSIWLGSGSARNRTVWCRFCNFAIESVINNSNGVLLLGSKTLPPKRKGLSHSDSPT